LRLRARFAWQIEVRTQRKSKKLCELGALRGSILQNQLLVLEKAMVGMNN
jgi:hypothetical protein